MHNYKIKYKFDIETDPAGYTVKDITEDDGLSDGLVVFSILYPEDGSYSQKLVCAFNGETKKSFTDHELFKLWSVLGLGLSNYNELPSHEASIMTDFAYNLRKLVLEGNNKKSAPEEAFIELKADIVKLMFAFTNKYANKESGLYPECAHILVDVLQACLDEAKAQAQR